MLGRNTPAIGLDQLEHQWTEALADGVELLDRRSLGTQQVHVQVTVADMTEPDHLETGIVLGYQLVELLEKLGNAADSHRQIVLVGSAMRDGFADGLTPGPQLGRLGA